MAVVLSTPENFQQPVIQSISRGNRVEYRLAMDYCFEWEENGKRYRRTVFKTDPACECDWETDLASTPDGAALLGFRKLGPSDAGAILHDRGYEIFGALKQDQFPPGEFQVLQDGQWVDCPERWTRLRCDQLYRRMCILGGMPVWRANIEFAALRVGAISRKNGLRWYFS